jgi:predicted porin
VKSDALGKVSVGKQSQASDNTAILVDGSGSLVPANWVLFDGASFSANVNGAATGLTWGLFNWCATINDGIGGDCNGITENVVRYDSPVFGGFSVSASWGEDDMWDVAARYAGEWNGIKVAVAAAYSETTDENLAINDTTGALAFGNVVKRKDVGYFQAGAYIEHVPTGLWGYAAYGKEDNDSIYQGVICDDFVCDNDGGEFRGSDQETWYFKAGLRERWSPIGHTVLYGEYGKTSDGIFPGLVAAGVTDSEMKRYGLGVVQEIDAAAMSVWLAWRHHDADFDCAAGGTGICAGGPGEISLDEVDIVKFGGLINF